MSPTIGKWFPLCHTLQKEPRISVEVFIPLHASDETSCENKRKRVCLNFGLSLI